MMVGGCWPAMDTAMEDMAVDKQWRQPWYCVFEKKFSLEAVVPNFRFQFI